MTFFPPPQWRVLSSEYMINAIMSHCMAQNIDGLASFRYLTGKIFDG